MRSNSQSSAVGGFQLEGYAMTFAWNIVRTYTLTPGRRYSFGCQYRLGTASNLVMYVSATDNDYVGVTGILGGAAGRSRQAALRSLRRVHPRLVQQSAGTLDLYSMQIRASAFEGDSVSVTDLLADSLALTRPRWTGSPRRATWAATSCCATAWTPRAQSSAHSSQPLAPSPGPRCRPRAPCQAAC